MGIKLDRFELRISRACGDKCIFCCERDEILRAKTKFLPFAEAIKTLAERRRRGFRHVTFIGGEPALHPRFEEIACWAFKLGYKTQLSTSGFRFADKTFAASVLPHLSEICVSVQGWNERSMSESMGAAGRFALLCKALDNIGGQGKNTTLMCNTVIHKGNADNLGKILSLVLKKTGAGLFMVSNLVPWGTAAERYDELVVSLSGIREIVAGLVAKAESAGIDIRFFGVPACVLNPQWKYSNDYHWAPRAMLESRDSEKRGRYSIERINLIPPLDRIKVRQCAKCAFQSWCGGMFRTYIRRFGSDELIPIKK